jgi:hypothetical protein
VKAVLHGGPCDGRVDENLREPAPAVYVCHKEVMPEGWETAGERDPTPEVGYEQYHYQLVRTQDDVAEYEHAPELDATQAEP